MKNRDGYEVTLSVLDQVDMYPEGGCSVRQESGWSLFISADELDGFVPQVGDVLVVYTKGFNTLAGLVIDNRVLRYKTPKQLEAEHKQLMDSFRLQALERYLKDGEALKARVKDLHPVFQTRMNRFDKEKGIDFWIDDAAYEMAVLEGAQALLNVTADLYGAGYAEKHGTPEDISEVEYQRTNWIERWENLKYDEQMKFVPDFGDGHSGNTYSAAVAFAKLIIRGEGEKIE